ncbi:MAG TPA: hypothetical protein VI386_00495 [Candidatus Sulfotelmatobacter sp.]
MSTIPPARVLAVEIRAARMGYAIFENHKRLLDFGAAWFDSPGTARLRIARLLRLSHPSLLVVRSGSSPRSQKALRKSVARTVYSEARKLSIPVARVSNIALKRYFETFSCRDKYAVATLLATRFPEIAWRIPERRKFFDPEPRVMIYFDAMALGVVYMDIGCEEQ